MLPAQDKSGAHEYHFLLRSPSGARIGTVTPVFGRSASTAALAYTDIQSPGRFTLRDPFLLQSMALLPQRLEADTSLYSLGARDQFQAVLRGENGRSLDARFDERAAAGDTGLSAWHSHSRIPPRPSAYGLNLTPDPESPRRCRFSGGAIARDSVFRIDCSVRMGAVRLKKSFHVKIQDLTPVSIGIKYVKDNRVLEEDGASLLLSNRHRRRLPVHRLRHHGGRPGLQHIARLDLCGRFRHRRPFPDRIVPARSRRGPRRGNAHLRYAGGGHHQLRHAHLPRLLVPCERVHFRPGVTGRFGPHRGFRTAKAPSWTSTWPVSSKAFTVSVKKPKVSGLLRSSPREEVVGDILDIELSESQPFKADSGAVMRLPVSQGIAQKRKVYLGHWNSARLSWEKVDSAQGGSPKWAERSTAFPSTPSSWAACPWAPTISSPLPIPSPPEDPWGLQLGYKISSDVSSQVGVRVEVYNMMGDKVYESQEVQLSKGDNIQPGTRRAAPCFAGAKGRAGALRLGRA